MRFDQVTFDPTLDDWDYRWEWRKQPVLEPDVCNPTLWKGHESKLDLMWRNSACSCTNADYTWRAPNRANVSAIAGGRAPWKILKLGTLPEAPVSRENVWYQGPNSALRSAMVKRAIPSCSTEGFMITASE